MEVREQKPWRMPERGTGKTHCAGELREVAATPSGPECSLSGRRKRSESRIPDKGKAVQGPGDPLLPTTSFNPSENQIPTLDSVTVTETGAYEMLWGPA